MGAHRRRRCTPRALPSGAFHRPVCPYALSVGCAATSPKGRGYDNLISRPYEQNGGRQGVPRSERSRALGVPRQDVRPTSLMPNAYSLMPFLARYTPYEPVITVRSIAVTTRSVEVIPSSFANTLNALNTPCAATHTSRLFDV